MNFNDALTRAKALAMSKLPHLQEDIFLVRDLHGRIRVLLKSPDHGGRPKEPFERALKDLAKELSNDLGGYAYSKKDLFLFRDDLPSLRLPDANSSTVLAEAGGFKVCLHDRLLMGTEWNARPIAEATKPRRFTLFSMKGGVGRSTTASVLARHLSGKGKRVLVFDLDLESPGIGATLLGESLPRFGIVDWFVEDALGQGDSVLLDMVRDSTLATGGGAIMVVPAFGSDTDDYLPKLGRTYLERGPKGHEPWPSRLRRLVEALEAQCTPDVVLLDSRTGLHDTSAALVLAMGAHTLMFAIDTPQTWAAYGYLFRHWMQHPDIAAFYDKLWVVGAVVPDSEIGPYVEGLRDRAWTLFDETLYAAPQVANRNGFSAPVVGDEAGNHYPRAIIWQRGLMAFNPLASWTDQVVTAAYRDFLVWFDRVLLEEPEAP